MTPCQSNPNERLRVEAVSLSGFFLPTWHQQRHAALDHPETPRPPTQDMICFRVNPTADGVVGAFVKNDLLLKAMAEDERAVAPGDDRHTSPYGMAVLSKALRPPAKKCVPARAVSYVRFSAS